jgi:RNA polymerase sigma factor (sigma-70 family)
MESAAMASGSVGSDLRNQLNVLFGFGVVGDISDGQLLQRFLTARDGDDQAAFTALVQRHGPMVLGVCREVLGNSHDAQDAFQATFLVLARKAGSVRKADSLASWLYGVARRVAIGAKAEAARRRLYERRSAAMKAVEIERQGSSPEGWPELHEEIARLPERYREPVVLCYLEGLTAEEAAMRIGCPPGTIFSRLSRARERLRGQLERRSLTSSPALLPTASTHRAMEVLPAGLLDTTVRAAIAFAGSRSSEAGLASSSATALAKGALHTMAISKLKILGAMALTCGFAWGGVWTFGQSGGLGGNQRPVGAVPHAGEPKSSLTRLVDELQSELDESARRNIEMRKALQGIRADLKALRTSQQPFDAKRAAILLAEAINRNSAQAASRLADVLKRHPARLSRNNQAPNRSQIYMLDLVEGGTTLVADEAIPNYLGVGTPVWSHDGGRILFETARAAESSRGELFAIEARDGRPAFTDLGAGSHPTFSPDDKQIAFVLNPDTEPGAEGGLWLMNADGSERRRLSDFGAHGEASYGRLTAPFWSADGHEFLINSHSVPTLSTVINLDTKDGGVVNVAGHQILSWPSWVGPGTLVSSITTEGAPDSIALLDVRNPAEAKLIEVFWKRNNELDVTPRWPVYRPDTRNCFFVGDEPTKRTLYMVPRGESLKARRMDVVERRPLHSRSFGCLRFSPDGRYMLFTAERPTQE